MGVNGQGAAGTGGEHHQTHDAFAVNFFAVFLDEDFAGETTGSFDEHCGGTGMDSEFVRDQESFVIKPPLVACFALTATNNE